MKFTRLSHQILAVFVVVVILALGVSGWAITTLAQRIVADNVARGQQTLVLRIAEEIDLEMEGARPLLWLLAESATVKSMDPAGVATELARYQARFPVLTAAYVADPSGQQIARTDGGALENVATTFGFQVAGEGHELLSDVYLPQGGQGPMLTTYLPITDDPSTGSGQRGRVVGVLVVDVNFARVQAILENLALTRNETAVVFAPNGRAVAHSRMAGLAEPPALTDPTLIEALVRGPAGVVEGYTDELGRTVMGVHAPVSELGWGVVIQTPVGELASQVATLRQTMAIGLLGGIALAVIAGWLMAGRLAEPIGRLARATERVAAGDLATAVEVRSANELGVLANGFNRMVATLKTSRDEEERLYEEVKELNVGLEQRVNLATGEIQQRADELAALYEVGRELGTTLELEVLLPAVAQQVMTALGADRCAVFLFDEKAGVLRARAAHGYMADRLADFIYRPGEESVGQAYAAGETQYVPNLYLVAGVPRRDEIRALLAVPLVSSAAARLGVLSVTSLRPDSFTPDQRQLLETMAGQVAGAIEKAWLHEETQRRAAELVVLYEMGKEITSALKLDTMLQTIADNAVRVVEAEKSLILLVEAEKKRLTRAVGHGYSQAQLDDHTFEDLQDGLSGWVLRWKVPTLADDIQTDERNRGKALASARRSGDRSAAVASLLIGDEVIGTLTVVNSQRGRAFTPADLNLVTMMAGQAAIAIHNAWLYEAAQEADRLKSAFLATMSHELRTPLNSIIGFTGILLQGLSGPLNDEQTKQLGMTQVSARHLLDLINDVLDISKIEAGQLEMALEPFDMRQAIEKVVQTVTPLAEKKGLALLTRVAPEVGQITSDRRRVEQILINLANNAIKFTDAGQVTVTADLIPELSIHNPQSAIRIQVADTGMGIKPEDMDTLFQAFRQIDTRLTRQHEGTGLGLSICKKLAEMLGGEIGVESEWGVGSTFIVRLPAEI